MIVFLFLVISIFVTTKRWGPHAEYPAVNLAAQTSPDHRRRDPLVFYASEAVNLAFIVIYLHTTLYIV
jgi:hypothetical protein